MTSDTDRLAALLRRIDYMNWTAAEVAEKLAAAGVTLAPQPDTASPDVRGDVHVLTFPPHPGGFYITSALCSCGGFQWDADNVEALVAATNEVWTDFRQHIIEGTLAPQPDTASRIDMGRCWIEHSHDGTEGHCIYTYAQPDTDTLWCPSCRHSLRMHGCAVTDLRGPCRCTVGDYAPQPDLASRLREAAQAVVDDYDLIGDAPETPDDPLIAALRAALAATEGEARDE